MKLYNNESYREVFDRFADNDDIEFIDSEMIKIRYIDNICDV